MLVVAAPGPLGTGLRRHDGKGEGVWWVTLRGFFASSRMTVAGYRRLSGCRARPLGPRSFSRG